MTIKSKRGKRCYDRGVGKALEKKRRTRSFWFFSSWFFQQNVRDSFSALPLGYDVIYKKGFTNNWFSNVEMFSSGGVWLKLNLTFVFLLVKFLPSVDSLLFVILATNNFRFTIPLFNVSYLLHSLSNSIADKRYPIDVRASWKAALKITWSFSWMFIRVSKSFSLEWNGYLLATIHHVKTKYLDSLLLQTKLFYYGF